MRQPHSATRTSRFARTATLAAATAALLSAPALAQSKPDSIVAPDGGVAMCKALTPADFARVGLKVGDANASTDSGDPGSTYCLYPNPTGKIELDIFYGASTTPVQAMQIERVTLGSVGAQFKAVSLPEADDPQMGTGHSGASAFTSVVFRRGTAVLMLAIPTTPIAHDQLLSLARVVIGRIHRA